MTFFASIHSKNFHEGEVPGIINISKKRGRSQHEIEKTWVAEYLDKLN